MKYILVIGDGMADTGLAQLAGKTPLEALALPAFDRAAGCFAGRALTIPHGLPAGSDTAILSIFGYAPQTYYSGRSVLEAAGMGLSLPPAGASLRINLCAALPDEGGQLVLHSHNGGGIHGDPALTLMRDLIADPAFSASLQRLNLSIEVTNSFRHIGVAQTDGVTALRLTEPHNILLQPIEAHLPGTLSSTPPLATQQLCEALRELMLLSHQILKAHPINLQRQSEGLLPANILWPWGAATAMTLPSFESLFGFGGVVISAVPLVWGIASLAGLQTPRVEGANGELDTNYEGKADAAVHALLKEGYSFAAVHVEAPDEMAHAGDLGRKLEAIQNVESRVVSRLLEQMTQSGESFRLLLISDHLTLLTTRMHDGSPVPYAIYDSRTVSAARHAGKPTPLRKFCEKEFLCEPVLMDGTDLMKVLFEQL